MEKIAKRLVFSGTILLLVLCLSMVMVGCRPGYKEVWEPVHVPTLEWERNDDIGVISSRIQSDLLDKELDVEPIIAKMRDDGKFEGYDYEIKTRTETWAPLEHLRSVEKLLIAYKTEGNQHYQDKRIKEFVSKAIAFFVDGDFYCEWNGWNNTIGLGLTIPNILLLDDGDIIENDRQNLLSRIKGTLLQNSKKRFRLYEREVAESGGNLTDQVNATLKVATIEQDGNTIMWLKGLLENELRPFPAYKGAKYHRWDAEGPKEDFSFQQHDQMLYYGGYGEVFLNGINRYMRYTKDTQYMLSNTALDFYADFITEGMQFATRNGYRDISASGRGVARKDGLRGIFGNVDRASSILLEYASDCHNVSADRVARLETMRADRFGDTDSGAGGHRYFYESDYNVYNDTNYMATVRHASDRTRVYEYLNFENHLGYYTGVGATFYYVDGDEYFNLMPVFDWNKVPGTTTRQGRLPKLSQDASYNRYGNNGHVGGVSNGRVGLSTFKQDDHLLTAKKSYFMFADGVVCLGNGIYTGMPERVVTNINQTAWRGDVIVGHNGTADNLTESTERAFSGEVDYIYHNHIGYITDSEVELTLDKDREGAWNRVYTKGDSAKVTADIFSLDIDHGRFPISKDYAYTVLMNTTPSATAEYAKDPTLVVVANDKRVQAVYDKKNDMLEVVFLQKATIEVAGKKIGADEPCSMIVENIKGDSDIWIASNDYLEHDVDMIYGDTIESVHITKKSTRV